MLLAAGCALSFGQHPTATPDPPTATRIPQTAVVRVEGGDLYVQVGSESEQKIASGGVIAAVMSPDMERAAFTRGTAGFPTALWSIRVDGSESRQLVARDDLRSGGGRPYLLDIAWLDNESILFNTAEQYAEGVVHDDNLYRVDLDGVLSLLLPPGSGGAFAASPDGAWIAAVSPGRAGLEPGVVRLLPPDGSRVRDVVTFDSLIMQQNAPQYPPLRWRDNVLYAAIPERMPGGDLRYVCWRIPTAGEARIDGYEQTADGC